MPKLFSFFPEFRDPKVLDVCHAEVQFRTDLKPNHLTRQLLRVPQIVGIQESDKLTLCYTQSSVARRRRSGTGLPRVANPVIVIGDHGGGVIGRAIVHDNDLQRPVRLGQNAIERLVQVPLAIEDGDNTTDQWSVHNSMTLVSSPSPTADDSSTPNQNGQLITNSPGLLRQA